MSTCCLPVCLPSCLPTHLPVCLSFCLLACLTVCLYSCLYICLLACYPVRLFYPFSVCMSLFLSRVMTLHPVRRNKYLALFCFLQWVLFTVRVCLSVCASISVRPSVCLLLECSWLAKTLLISDRISRPSCLPASSAHSPHPPSSRHPPSFLSVPLIPSLPPSAAFLHLSFLWKMYRVSSLLPDSSLLYFTFNFRILCRVWRRSRSGSNTSGASRSLHPFTEKKEKNYYEPEIEKWLYVILDKCSVNWYISKVSIWQLFVSYHFETRQSRNTRFQFSCPPASRQFLPLPVTGQEWYVILLKARTFTFSSLRFCFIFIALNLISLRLYQTPSSNKYLLLFILFTLTSCAP